MIEGKLGAKLGSQDNIKRLSFFKQGKVRSFWKWCLKLGHSPLPPPSPCIRTCANPWIWSKESLKGLNERTEVQGYPQEIKTTKTTVRSLYCMFHYIFVYLWLPATVNLFLTLTTNGISYIRGRRLDLTLESSNFVLSLRSYPLWLTLYIW